MKRLIIFVAALFLAVAPVGCASVSVGSDASPRMRVAAASSDYLLVQEGIKTYLLLPPCAGTTLPVCKSTAVVAVLQKGNTAASSALDYAEAVVVTPGASPSTIELALGAALEAVKSLKAIKSTFGVK